MGVKNAISPNTRREAPFHASSFHGYGTRPLSCGFVSGRRAM